MPGKAIGKELNPMPHLVWRGYIQIERVAGKYEHKIQGEDGDPAADKIVREYIEKAIDELRKRP